MPERCGRGSNIYTISDTKEQTTVRVDGKYLSPKWERVASFVENALYSYLYRV